MPTAVVTHERVLAGEIRAGDRVARTRTRGFYEVAAVWPSAIAIRIAYVGGGSDRPRQTAKWWREVAAC